MQQARWWMALIGLIMVWGTGGVWAAEEAAGAAPQTGLTPLYPPLTGTVADAAVSLRHHGLVTFAGGQPVYDCQAGVLLVRPELLIRT